MSCFASQVAAEEACASPPRRLKTGAVLEFAGIPGGVAAPSLDAGIRNAIAGAVHDAPFAPNVQQVETIAWALGRSVALVRGPPGTGKTRTASVLIAAALRLGGAAEPGASKAAALGPPGSNAAAPRVLAVAHSNGAADVLLAALHLAGVNAIRSGRPTAVSPAARRFTTASLAERHPEVVALRARANNASLPSHERSRAKKEAYRSVEAVRESLTRQAQVVVASCVGAHALIEAKAGEFDLVVLDEAAQTTEPALCCALSAAKAEQVVFFGDSRQLPPTVVSADPDLRRALGVSPMERLERSGVRLQTLRVQYRMPPSLIEHFRRADTPQTGRGDAVEMSRGDAAAAAWVFRGDESRRRRGCDVGIPLRRDATAATWTFGQDAAAATRSRPARPQVPVEAVLQGPRRVVEQRLAADGAEWVRVA